MATLNYLVRTKQNPAPVYIRFSAGRGKDIVIKSGLKVDPDMWSNKKQSLKILIETDPQVIKTNKELTDNLNGLKKYIINEYQKLVGDPSRDWLAKVIEGFFNPSGKEGLTLNEYISLFISKAKTGDSKNRDSVNFAPGTVRGWKGFQRIFNEYQGIYTEKRIKELAEKEKVLRPLRTVDFEDITPSFYEAFKTFLSNEGYKVNTIGRFIKNVKFFMQKSLFAKKHSNREFQNRDVFKIPKEKSFSVYLNQDEVEKIYKYDLKKYPRMQLARDAFIVLCETALRVSDYKKIELNIREIHGRKLIYITQTKTNNEVVIPASKRMIEILKKYDNKLPSIPDQYINEYIKTIASWCKIDEVLRWEGNKFGKKYEKSAKKYELISCHTGRRTAITNMVKAKIPLAYVMSISGHRTEKQLLEYVKLTPEEIALELSAHEYFTGIKLKVG